MKAVWDTVTLKASWTLNNNLPCRAGQPVSGPGVAWPLKCSEEPQLFISLQPGPPALSFQRTTPNDYWMPSFSLASILLPTCIHIICPFMQLTNLPSFIQILNSTLVPFVYLSYLTNLKRIRASAFCFLSSHLHSIHTLPSFLDTKGYKDESDTASALWELTAQEKGQTMCVNNWTAK